MENDKTYPCRKCDKVFKHQPNRSRHEKTHAKILADATTQTEISREDMKLFDKLKAEEAERVSLLSTIF